MRKGVLLVLDGSGIGAIKECREVKTRGHRCHTYQHIDEHTQLEIPTLKRLCFNKIVSDSAIAATKADWI